ncbi:MAG: lysozyme, partial [Porphyrobacter sp. HL-46]
MLHHAPSPLLALIRRLLGETRARTAPNPDAPALPEQAAFPALDSVSCVSNTTAPRAVSAAGIALIKRFEGCARLRRDGMIEAY